MGAIGLDERRQPGGTLGFFVGQGLLSLFTKALPAQRTATINTIMSRPLMNAV